MDLWSPCGIVEIDYELFILITLFQGGEGFGDEDGVILRWAVVRSFWNEMSTRGVTKLLLKVNDIKIVHT